MPREGQRCGRRGRRRRGAVPRAVAKRLGQVLGCVGGDRRTSTGTRRARSARPSKPSCEASPHFTGSHSSVNTTSTKRRVVGNKFTVEPISQITYLLTGATWIFAVILMIPPPKRFPA